MKTPISHGAALQLPPIHLTISWVSKRCFKYAIKPWDEMRAVLQFHWLWHCFAFSGKTLLSEILGFLDSHSLLFPPRRRFSVGAENHRTLDWRQGLASRAFYIASCHRVGRVAGGLGRMQQEMALHLVMWTLTSPVDGSLTSGGRKIKAKAKHVRRGPASLIDWNNI